MKRLLLLLASVCLISLLQQGPTHVDAVLEPPNDDPIYASASYRPGHAPPRNPRVRGRPRVPQHGRPLPPRTVSLGKHGKRTYRSHILTCMQAIYLQLTFSRTMIWN
ncbi:uncharacterized protein LOC125759563 isoform X1 [Rhipicephalus sanguineus]|uniref:uncharacterized protein LOC125759563 isoform X1 n=1 Tax=Rhipicephalus sanguineus TaxID=34632 RepID=UPI0020C1F411|nr:uncharacterized protein LOC125759563 isoform X1 [Rhipicephalus sanguineus]